MTIAGGVLLIACINFTTLAIGRSVSRAKEVGVRKVIGGSRGSIAGLFLVESYILVLLSAAGAAFLANLLLPVFNRFSGRELQFSVLQFPELIWLNAALLLTVGMLAGMYPALILSGFKPVEVLKAKIKLGGSNLVTKTLVTVQFVLSAGLIIGTVIIMQQLHYLNSKNPGFNKENIVDVDAGGISKTKNLFSVLKQSLSENPAVVEISSADAGFGEGAGSNQMAYKYEGRDKLVYEYFVDPDFLQTLGLKLIAGRNFNAAIATDTVSSVIINEAMLHDLGWNLQNAIGRKIAGYYQNAVNDLRTPIVVGVVKNFNYLDLRQQIQPQMFDQFSYFQPKHFFIRIRPGDPSQALAALELTWKKIAPDYPLKFNFLDENLSRFYESESRWSHIVGWAGGISIALACLGLLGLAALAAVNRTKEIGIRKVLGASVESIMKLLSRDFLRLIVIALVIALPIAWYLMDKWLQGYAYRISEDWRVFVLTGAGIILLALLTLCSMVLKAGRSNPVDSLRIE
jgi:putative ABC transport system permease protein